MRTFVIAAGLVLVGCYTPRRIQVPPTEDGLNCMRECMAKQETCKSRPAMRSCREDYDRCLMVCPGAKPDTSAEERPMDLPGAIR